MVVDQAQLSVSRFFLNVVELTNKFVAEAERKLIAAESRMDRLEANIAVLKHKCMEIPDEDVPVSKSEPAVEPPKMQKESQEASVDVSEIEEQQEEGLRAKDHPLYKKFFKLLQIGANMNEIKQRMQFEGLDPDILE